MLYKMIQDKRDEWYNSSQCTVRELVQYMIDAGQMRDAQIDAIKTYLFLKIACDNRSLYDLFITGQFNTIDIDNIELTTKVKDFLVSNRAALALYQYATLKNNKGEQVSQKLEKAIKSDPEGINYNQVFKDIFYGVTYTDYLFSLPMGAGKTYLMAAFIYLDLYFAINEPDNKSFAHNFIVFAPSGLKSSIVPSLKTIKNFNPDWVIPEPSAGQLKKLLKFELLDQAKSTNKSNKTKNPNVQKISIHQPIDELVGLVAVTNAEKVILDRLKIENGNQINFLEESDDEKDRKANELRNLIGKLPNLSIFIDEVHHATKNEIKLRGIINKWQRDGNTINSVIGFSGTPYLDKAHTTEITDVLKTKSLEISNIVYYYPLISGINNFLKRPVVKRSNSTDGLHIIEMGVRDFLDQYKNTTYENGACAKLAIFCGKNIAHLEDVVYPHVVNIVYKYGYEPNKVILKYHGGNKNYSVSEESKVQFESLDKDFSSIKIVLLLQIGKEGWDCRSLTGVILAQEGDCAKNMVLQTSCRCLRQVDKGKEETALIWLNEFNAKKLDEQLQKQHHISINEFEKGGSNTSTEIKRYNRMEYLNLPKVEFYQLRVQHNTIIIEDNTHIDYSIDDIITENSKLNNIVKTQDFEQNISDTQIEKSYAKSYANFDIWLYGICKNSFGAVAMQMLYRHKELLEEVFNIITIEEDGQRYYSSEYRLSIINANIRKLFYDKRTLETIEDTICENASLLKVDNFKPIVYTMTPADYFPTEIEVDNIIREDKGKLKVDNSVIDMIKSSEDNNDHSFVVQLRKRFIPHPQRNKSFHYLPYKTDSGFEQLFLEEILSIRDFKEKDLECYYNGDRALTEFKIKCYKGKTGRWKYIGMYTPDFLIVKRKDDRIYQAIIVETKGKIYANDERFKEKKAFMKEEFIKKNNEKFGYNRFDYLYLQDDLSDDKKIHQTVNAIEQFFRGE